MKQQAGYPCSPHCAGYLKEIEQRKQIASAVKAIDREQIHIRRLVQSRIDGGPTVSDVDAAFQRMREALTS